MHAKYLTEFLGTFFLVMVIALTKGNALAIGIALAALVYGGGYISGAHYNPAVSIGMYVRGKLSQIDLVKYMSAQILGAVFAEVMFQMITKNTFLATPVKNMPLLSVFLVEFIFTFALVYTVLHVATGKGTKGNDYYGLAIGGVLMAGIFAGASVSGAVYNPAVALGPALLQVMTGGFIVKNLLVYLLSQAAAGVSAAVVFKKTQ